MRLPRAAWSWPASAVAVATAAVAAAAADWASCWAAASVRGGLARLLLHRGHRGLGAAQLGGVRLGVGQLLLGRRERRLRLLVLRVERRALSLELDQGRGEARGHDEGKGALRLVDLRLNLRDLRVEAGEAGGGVRDRRVCGIRLRLQGGDRGEPGLRAGECVRRCLLRGLRRIRRRSRSLRGGGRRGGRLGRGRGLVSQRDQLAHTWHRRAPSLEQVAGMDGDPDGPLQRDAGELGAVAGGSVPPPGLAGRPAPGGGREGRVQAGSHPDAAARLGEADMGPGEVPPGPASRVAGRSRLVEAVAGRGRLLLDHDEPARAVAGRAGRRRVGSAGGRGVEGEAKEADVGQQLFRKTGCCSVAVRLRGPCLTPVSGSTDQAAWTA
jgi:hypothetical protein